MGLAVYYSILMSVLSFWTKVMGASGEYEFFLNVVGPALHDMLRIIAVL